MDGPLVYDDGLGDDGGAFMGTPFATRDAGVANPTLLRDVRDALRLRLTTTPEAMQVEQAAQAALRASASPLAQAALRARAAQAQGGAGFSLRGWLASRLSPSLRQQMASAQAARVAGALRAAPQVAAFAPMADTTRFGSDSFDDIEEYGERMLPDHVPNSAAGPLDDGLFDDHIASLGDALYEDAYIAGLGDEAPPTPGAALSATLGAIPTWAWLGAAAATVWWVAQRD